MRKLGILLIAILSSWVVLAQQDPQFSMNMYNHLSYNPGYAGSNQAVCATALHRQQWLGFDGRPVTTALNVHGEIKSISSGVGLSIQQDNIGDEKNVWITGDYAYRMKLGDGFLGLGLSIGLYNKAIDGDWQTPDMLSGNSDSPYDDVAIPFSESKMAFDAGFGAFYRTNDGLYVGLAATHLPQSKFNFSGVKLNYLKRHYYFTAGYPYELPNRLFIVEPSLFIKTDGASTQYDINAKLEYKRMVWGGISYRVSDAFVAMVGVSLPNNIRFAIAYDFTTNAIGNYSSGSIEIMASYCFSLKVQNRTGSYKSVRFL